MEFEDTGITQEELGWVNNPSGTPEVRLNDIISTGIYKILLINIDGQTGEVMLKMASSANIRTYTLPPPLMVVPPTSPALAFPSATPQGTFSLNQARPYQVVGEGNLANENKQRAVGLWYINSEEADSFEEYAQTAVKATIDLYQQNKNDFTAVILVPRPDVKVVYAEASYAVDGKGAAGMTGSVPAVPMYWHVRAMDDLQYNEQELAVMKLWQDKLADFPSRDPLSSLSYDEPALRQYIADTLKISYNETQPRPRKMAEYKLDAAIISPTGPSASSPSNKSFTTEDAVLGLVATANELWATTSSGVIRWDLENGSQRKYTMQDGLASDNARKIIRDSRGSIWVTCYVSGVSRFDGNKWDSFTVKNGLCSNETITLAADKSGGVWVSAYWGVSCFDGQQWSSYSNVSPDEPAIGGPNPMKDCQNLTLVDGELSAADMIFIDSHGNVWFSSRGRGVTRYDGKDWRLFTSKDGLGTGGINTIFEDKDGVIWFDGSTGISSFDGAKFTFHLIPAYQSVVPRPIAQDILQDNQGNLWLAAYGGGVVRFNGKDWQAFSVQDGLPSVNAQALFLTKDGYPGVITDKGVCRFDGNTWQLMTAADGLPESKVRVVVSDGEGNLWFGAKGKVSYYSK
ncbi:MAG: hypothetical protein PHF12_00320 [Candidatus Omnitrophica bacterium]|nr:hypothetical protein [Candidatus Omnitrophota bacterium]